MSATSLKRSTLAAFAAMTLAAVPLGSMATAYAAEGPSPDATAKVEKVDKKVEETKVEVEKTDTKVETKTEGSKTGTEEVGKSPKVDKKVEETKTDKAGTEVSVKTKVGSTETEQKGHVPVTICHATSSKKNPYVTETVDADSVKYKGHLAHVNGIVFPADGWGDIIPAPAGGCPTGEEEPPPPPPAKTKVTASGDISDACGPDFNLEFTNTTEGVTYVQKREGNTLTVTATAKDGYELTNPAWSVSKTDGLVKCDVPPVINDGTLTATADCDNITGSTSRWKDVTVVVRQYDANGGKPISETEVSANMQYSVKVVDNAVHYRVLVIGQDGVAIKIVDGDLKCDVPPPPPPAKTKVTASGDISDACGPDFNLEFTNTTEGVTYVQKREGNTLTVTATAKDGYELTNPAWSVSKTDGLVKCDVPPPPPPVLETKTETRTVYGDWVNVKDDSDCDGKMVQTRTVSTIKVTLTYKDGVLVESKMDAPVAGQPETRTIDVKPSATCEQPQPKPEPTPEPKPTPDNPVKPKPQHPVTPVKPQPNKPVVVKQAPKRVYVAPKAGGTSDNGVNPFLPLGGFGGLAGLGLVAFALRRKTANGDT